MPTLKTFVVIPELTEKSLPSWTMATKPETSLVNITGQD